MSDYILLSISILSNGLYNAVIKLLGRKSDGSLRGTMRVNAAIYAVISVVVGAAAIFSCETYSAQCLILGSCHGDERRLQAHGARHR